MCLGFLLMEQGHASSSTPSVSSSSVGMISIKCAENVSKSSDLDCVIVSQEGVLAAENTQNQENPAKRKKPLKSEVWNHFDRFEIDTKGMLLGIKNWLNGKRALVHNGDMFHMRCVAHILNLIVKSGLEMVDHLIEKIQKTARYIGSSAQRDEKFTIALSQTKFNTKRQIPFDVCQRLASGN
ncbi:uncharacterized protein LOC141702485 isoform X1 [Apium graveolens]|uniref:uncharacterized protein LOC141702485 isoform X1 n=1 Tax=Apium graveolens TaxID=4045 RepID=UPI003D79EDE9